jgi:hypothetical protein
VGFSRCLAVILTGLTRLTFADSDMTSIGDVKDLSSTAAVMLKTSILAAWARFQTASTRQPYLVDVIRPHLPLLCPFWVASLREYARMHVDPTALSSEAGSAFDSVYSGLSRETALPVGWIWPVSKGRDNGLTLPFSSSMRTPGLKSCTPLPSCSSLRTSR